MADLLADPKTIRPDRKTSKDPTVSDAYKQEKKRITDETVKGKGRRLSVLPDSADNAANPVEVVPAASV